MYLKYLGNQEIEIIKKFAEQFIKESYLQANRVTASAVAIAEVTIKDSEIKIRVEIGERNCFYAEENLRLTSFKAYKIDSYSPPTENIALTKQWAKLLYRMLEYRCPAAAKSYKRNYKTHLRQEKSSTIKNAKTKYSELAL